MIDMGPLTTTKQMQEKVREPVVFWILILTLQVNVFLFSFLGSHFLVQVPPVDEPTTILDCYDFPPAFKTHHLHDIFRNYESMRGGYKIKWLSDTRALIIFEHPATGKGIKKRERERTQH